MHFLSTSFIVVILLYFIHILHKATISVDVVMAIEFENLLVFFYVKEEKLIGNSETNEN